MAEPNQTEEQVPETSDNPDSGSLLQPPSLESNPEPTATAHTTKTPGAPVPKPVIMNLGFKEKVKNWFVEWWRNPKKRYGTLGGLVLVLVVLFVIPLTRYNILGLVLKSQTTVTVVDSKTGQPVSGASVKFGSVKAQTEANGKAVLDAKMGSRTLQVSKKYYQSYSHKQLVVMSADHNVFKVKVLALGRQVQVRVVNKITKQPIAGAQVNAEGARAKTSAAGTATLVIGSGADTAKATVTLSGYNTQNVTITAGGTTAQNTFAVVPTGNVYFLSNLSGDIDVVKTNLDGSGRQTVLRGTGNEDRDNTSLLASRDWKYMALLSKRDASATSGSIYLIDGTNGDKLTTIDQADATFTLVGWSGDTFVYQESKNGVQQWQSNAYALKSYDATSGKTTLLDQSTGEGTSSSDYGYTNFSSVYILNNELFYAKNWYSSYQTSHLTGKSSTLTSIRPDGSGHKIVQSFPVPDGSQYYSINLSPYEPYGVYVQVPNGTSNTYYEYEDGALTAKSDVTDNQFSAPYATYLISPSSSSTFWSDERDGKNTLFTGNKDAGAKKQIATLSEYKPYGWYSDNYLLVSKNSSELYIMPVTGGTPLKVSDYYKPPVNYQGYGGGYGGL